MPAQAKRTNERPAPPHKKLTARPLPRVDRIDVIDRIVGRESCRLPFNAENSQDIRWLADSDNDCEGSSEEGRMKPILSVLLFLTLTASAAWAREPAAVWFSPGPETPDYTDLFSKPQLWPKARQHVDVIKLGPNQAFARAGQANDLAALQRVDAFRKMQQWNIDIAIEAPAVKEWDCSGQGNTKDPRVHGNAEAATASYIKNVFTAGAHVKFVAMDEPLRSGFGDCHETIDQVAAKTAAYVKTLRSDPNMAAWAPGLAVGDIEPYPSYRIDQLIQWTRTLERNGFKPAFFHLDVDVYDVNFRGNKLNFNGDMRALQSFFNAEGVPFGIVFWSGYDPEPTDASYYNHVVSWAHRVRAAIGVPEQSIFQSWVRRSSIKCTAEVRCGRANHWMCSPADPPYCGKSSMPINLPEHGPSSHTRLINAVTELLHGHPDRR